MDYKKHIAQMISAAGLEDLPAEELIIPTADRSMGDYSLPCFRLAKQFKKPPQAIAEQLAAALVPDGVISKVQAVSGYLNFTLNRAAAALETVTRILGEGGRYGSDRIGADKTICIDYSSVNIAKPFHIGHLSTTVIGAALYRIYKFLGYNVVGINHLGDYGTQFGKLIAAYKRWGSEQQIQSGRIKAMLEIYVKFHDEEQRDPSLTDEARGWFKKIEDNDPEALALLEWFKKLTLADIQAIYDRLGVTFDSYHGESFFNDKMQPVIDELGQKGLLKTDNGAGIVDLEEYGMPPCLIVKSDGTSLYATRDIAAALYRKQTYDFDKCLYVVAYQQNLHFKQFFKVLELMGRDFASDLVHVSYGMVSLEDGGSMSTRKGNVVFLENVIDACVAKAADIIAAKNPDLENRAEVAEKVGVGAVVFSALINNRIKDIVFSYERVLSFEGETAPYVQYTCARAHSVLAKQAPDLALADFSEVTDEESALASLLAALPGTVRAAAERYEPSFVTRLAIDIAKAYNKFYFECRILGESQGVMHRRLALTAAALTTLKNALALIGIPVPEKM